MADSAPVPIKNDWQAVQDHSRDYHQFAYVYPVISRRSGGLSIGVNLNPDKRCNFDCVYCEVDRRTPPRTRHLDWAQLGQELQSMVRYVKEGRLAREAKFADLPPGVATTIRDIAFSGDGEPTMIPNFAECVRAVAGIRSAESLSNTKLVLITDAAGLDKKDVREGLRVMDENGGEIWGKLDAGTEAYYQAVNRTHVRFERILANLTSTACVRPIVIQTLFFRLHGETMSAEELAAYCERLKAITTNGGQIREVHAYTIARPTPEPFATRLSLPELNTIAETVRTRSGLPVQVFD